MTQLSASVNYAIATNPQFNSLEITFAGKPAQEIREGFARYYHDRAAGEYHAIEYTTQPRAYRATFRIDPATGTARSYSGPLPTLRAAKRIMQALAPEAEPLHGLPAWLR